MRDERYEYDDLGHLRKTEQRVRHVNIVRNLNGFPDQVGSWQMLSSRSSNLRGDVTHAEQWRRISGPLDNISVDQVAAHTGTTTNAYRADGRVASTRTVADDPTKSTLTVNAYDAQTGQLSSYEFTAHRSDLTPYTAKFTYSHTLQNGNRVVCRISDAHLGLHTTKTYDPLGRLSRDRVDLPNPDPATAVAIDTRSASMNTARRVGSSSKTFGCVYLPMVRAQFPFPPQAPASRCTCAPVTA